MYMCVHGEGKGWLVVLLWPTPNTKEAGAMMPPCTSLTVTVPGTVKEMVANFVVCGMDGRGANMDGTKSSCASVPCLTSLRPTDTSRTKDEAAVDLSGVVIMCVFVISVDISTCVTETSRRVLLGLGLM